MLESLFKKLAGWRLATSLKKTPTQVFSCEVGEIFKNNFSYRTPQVTASALPVAASVFFSKKYYLTAISQPYYDVLIIFSSRHIVWWIKIRTCFFINFSSIVKFSKLKIGMLDPMNNTFRNTVFYISAFNNFSQVLNVFILLYKEKLKVQHESATCPLFIIVLHFYVALFIKSFW